MIFRLIYTGYFPESFCCCRTYHIQMVLTSSSMLKHKTIKEKWRAIDLYAFLKHIDLIHENYFLFDCSESWSVLAEDDWHSDFVLSCFCCWPDRVGALLVMCAHSAHEFTIYIVYCIECWGVLPHVVLFVLKWPVWNTLEVEI